MDRLRDLPIVARAGDAVLLIEKKSDGIFLYEFRPDGFIGDTWHQSVADAKHQATYWWGDKVSEWRQVPARCR